jgi:glycosyltransferase involved in cell wall biosynthesis
MDSPVTPLISVVIPVFNRREELRRALESLARQTYQSFEVVVCDDGSSEDIPGVLAAFASQLTIVSLRIPNSGGPARPRNTAISAAAGEWIALLDSDDWWDEGRLDVVRVHLTDSVDLLYHPLRVVRGPGVVMSPERRQVLGESLQGDALRHFALLGNPIPNSAVVVRKSVVQAIGGMLEDRELVAVEDFDTWMRLAESGARFHFLNQVLGSYWIGADGISAFSMRQIERLIAVFNRHVDRFDTAYREQARACHHYRIGSMLLQLGQDPKAAHGYLLSATPLPTAALTLKRWIKLAQARLRMGKVLQ